MNNSDADSNIHVMQHPLVAEHLAQLRDRDTPPAEFRRLIQRLSILLAYEATRELTLSPGSVETPLQTAPTQRLKERIGLIPILRAGLGMVDPILNLIPQAEVWHLGLYRNEETATPVEYYNKLPPDNPVDVAMILDPMLATGGSLQSAYEQIIEWGVPCVKMLSVIAAPEGIERIRRSAPQAEIFVCAVDECLNDKSFIVPGLGDAGDRTFATLR